MLQTTLYHCIKIDKFMFYLVFTALTLCFAFPFYSIVRVVPMSNGGVADKYYWTQTLTELNVSYKSSVSISEIAIEWLFCYITTLRSISFFHLEQG